MSDRQRIRKDGKTVYVDTGEGDARTNPEYSCDVEYVEVGGQRIGIVQNWMAFDPRYGPENQQQIDWHIAHGTPRAESFEIGVPL